MNVPIRRRTAVVVGGAAALLIGPCVLQYATGSLLAGPPQDETPAVTAPQPADETSEEEIDWKALTDAQWKARLTPKQYKILRQHGTERAGSGAYAFSKGKGVYDCAGCGQPLFDSKTKFESGTGWPSFYQPVDGVKGDNVGERIDRSWFSVRTEVHCDRCGGHLGHVFNDGPAPTGLRYCINSASLKFDPAEKNEEGDGAEDAPAED
jgi:peptide-methionine (R)-S-oxide reductase